MQALIESKVVLLYEPVAIDHDTTHDDTPAEHSDCYWLLLATHAMNRMVGVLEQSAGGNKRAVATLLARLSHAVAASLLGDASNKTKVDRLSSTSNKPAVRSLVGRAMVSLTVASTVALQALTASVEESVDKQSLWCAVFCLDLVIHQASTNITAGNKAALDGWHHTMASLNHVATANSNEDDEDDDIFEAADKILKPTAEEHTCLAALMEHRTLAAEAATPTTKRQRRPKKQHAIPEPTSLGTIFGTNLLQNKQTASSITLVLDGRMSMRRWPSMALCWLFRGQERILQVAHDLMALMAEDSTMLQLDCPAITVPTEVMASTPSPKRTSKKSKAAAAATTTLVAIPANVALVTLVTRLFSIVSEASNQGGTRSPTGGMDAYVQSVLSIGGKNSSSKRKSAGASSNNNNNKKPNVCNLVVTTVHAILELHTACLQEHCSNMEDDASTKKIKTKTTRDKRVLRLVNDDECAIVDGVARFCPHVHKSVEKLCRNAATDTSQSVSKLLTLASCHALQQVTAITNDDDDNSVEIVIMDAKLCNMAVAQFHFCFAFLLRDDDEAMYVEDESVSAAAAQPYQNLEPLPVPALTKKPAKGRGKKKDNDDEACTFAGILPQSPAIVERLDQTLLPLFFRAIPANDDDSSSPGAIISMLLDMLECCYNTRDQTVLPSVDDDKATPTKGKGTKGKKKKKAAAVAKKPTDEVPRLRRLNAVRAGLASDVCNVLRCMTTLHPLQIYFRSCIGTEQLCRFVKLAQVLDTILTTTSAREGSRATDAKKDATASFFNPSASDYNLYERTLWSAHTNLCCTLGRGSLLYSPRKRTKPILGDSKTRLAVFEAIPKACGTKEWPLHLSASHHALVASNLTTEPVTDGPNENNAPEEFVASAMIRSIARALKDPSLVTYSKWLGGSIATDEDEQINDENTTDERVPLSIRDGRLLLVAISRLSPKDQIKHVSTFATAMETSFAAYQEESDIMCQNAEVSQFLARVVTVYASMLNLATVDLRENLLAHVGPSQYALPQLYTLGSIRKGCLAKDGNWYKRESSFMGLYADWESPVVPTAETKQALPSAVLSKSNTIFEHALSIGFNCAGNDFGQLLFSTWNATGRKLTWDPKSLSAPHVQPYSSSKSLASLFLELRADICHVFIFFINGNRESCPDSLAGQMMKTARVKKITVKETLGKMVQKASLAIDFLVEKANSLDDDEDLSVIELALLEGLPVYIAFAIAMHTTTSDALFTRAASKKKTKNRKRRRLQTSGSGYDIELLASIMSDEDSVGSEDDYDYQDGEEGKIDALARLHDACNAFGAAPMHPDWLDSACSFRCGITPVNASENAFKAIAALTKLGSLAHLRHTLAVKNCMAVLAGKPPGDKSSGTAASLCCMAVDFSNGMLEECEDGKETAFQKAVSSMFDIPHVAIQDFYNDSASTGWRAAKEAWIPNCPQKIVGVLQSQSIDGIESTSSEYRAGGEWEMMISEALIGSCTGCGMDDSDYTIWKSFEVSEGKSDEKAHQVFNIYTREERWLRISQGLISQLMPAAALLRFSSAAGKGRDTHPLSVREGSKGAESISFASSAIELSQFSHLQFTVKAEQKESLSECVALLARRSARCNGDTSPKLSSKAVAANLLIEAKSFEELEGIESLHMAFETIQAVQATTSTKKSTTKDKLSSFRLITDLLIKMVQVRAHSPELNKIVRNESKVTRLLSALSGAPLDASMLGIVRFEKDVLVDKEWMACALKCLLFILCSDDMHVDALSRARVASLLSELMQMENTIGSAPKKNDTIRITLLDELSSVDDKRLTKLIEVAYPVQTESADSDRLTAEAAAGTCKILAFALSSVANPALSLKFCREVFEKLIIRFDSISSAASSRESSLGVLFLYACRVGSLELVGSSIVSNLNAESKGEPDLVPMECLLSFVQGLQTTLVSDAMEIDEAESAIKTDDKASPTKKTTESENTDASKSKNPRACSHVLRNGFFQQHWYNWYVQLTGLCCCKVATDSCSHLSQAIHAD